MLSILTFSPARGRSSVAKSLNLLTGGPEFIDSQASSEIVGIGPLEPAQRRGQRGAELLQGDSAFGQHSRQTQDPGLHALGRGFAQQQVLGKMPVAQKIYASAHGEQILLAQPEQGGSVPREPRR